MPSILEYRTEKWELVFGSIRYSNKNVDRHIAPDKAHDDLEHQGRKMERRLRVRSGACEMLRLELIGPTLQLRTDARRAARLISKGGADVAVGPEGPRKDML